jgi:hypothetical protein
MAYTRSGGGNFVAFYTIDQTAHASTGSSPVWTGNLLESTAWSRGEDGVYTGDFTQLADDADFYKFLEDYAPEPAEGAVTEVTLEDGTKIGGATGGSPEILMIKAGSLDSNDVRKGFAAVVKLATTSGSYTETNGEYSKPTLQVVSQKAKASISVESKLPTNLYSTTPAVVIATGTRGKVFHQPKNA